MHQQNDAEHQLCPMTPQSSVTQTLHCTISLPCTQPFSLIYGDLPLPSSTRAQGTGTAASTTTPREPFLLARAARHRDTKLSMTRTFLCTWEEE